MSTKTQPVVLAIAGLDASGGAGLLADIKTISAFGCYGLGVVTSITMQNTREVVVVASPFRRTHGRTGCATVARTSRSAAANGMRQWEAIRMVAAAIQKKNPLPTRFRTAGSSRWARAGPTL